MVDTILGSSPLVNVPDYSNHFKEVLDYSVIKDKRFRAPLVIDSYKILEKPENLTKENLHLVNVLGWCVELMIAYMNQSDDIMDESRMRCNEICWYLKKGVGLSGFNDSMFLYESTFILLKHYFHHTPLYLPLQNIFHEMNNRFVIGQMMDTKLKQNRLFNDFNSNNFTNMGQNKGGFPLIQVPFRIACALSNNDQEFYKVKDIIERMGQLLQIDNDILDVFQNGKIETDVTENIRQGQCTWLAVEVLENGSDELKKIFKENYGRTGYEYEQKVIDIYLKMNLFDKYLRFKEDILEYMQKRFKEIPQKSMQNAITKLFENVFL
ncbi:hypothetical protein FQA39_LY09084 [Lamprigera yunnana]|nr:hypothetical protein FQA39_LY09084 [Lamprigera yunnana]